MKATFQNGMKVRVWAGRPTLATEQGKSVATFEAFEAWLSKQPDGQIEVWAGRWFVVSKEARPFVVEGGKAFCNYRPYFGKLGANPRDFPGFFAYEAYKIAARQVAMYRGMEQLVSTASAIAKDGGHET